MTTQTNGNPELAERVARLEGAYERVDRQLESLDRRMETLEIRIESLRAETNARIDSLAREMRILFATTVVILIASMSAATAILALLLG